MLSLFFFKKKGKKGRLRVRMGQREGRRKGGEGREKRYVKISIL